MVEYGDSVMQVVSALVGEAGRLACHGGIITGEVQLGSSLYNHLCTHSFIHSITQSPMWIMTRKLSCAFKPKSLAFAAIIFKCAF